MKKVLIVVYYWPPSGGSGVQRWLKFAKYLSYSSWQPIIYTPENPDFSIKDETLLAEIPANIQVIKKPIWEPYDVARKLVGKQQKISSSGLVEKSGPLHKLINFLRGNLFVPDPKIFWKRPSVNFLSKYILENKVDALITSGTPHSLHLIGLALKKKLNVPWIADFRDPWSELDMLQNYHIMKPVMKKYRRLEKAVLENADLCTITSDSWRDDLKRLGAAKAVTLTNGFDEDNFKQTLEPYEKFVMSHFGLMNHLRNPKNLWQALAEICKENSGFDQSFALHLGGTIDNRILDEIKAYPELRNKLKVFPYLSHEEVLEEYQKSSLLLLLLFNSDSGRGNIPGKLFEYLAAKKPILGFGPASGDSKEIVEKLPHSYFNFYNTASVNELKAQIKSVFDARSALNADDFKTSERYSHALLTDQLVAILDETSGFI